MTKLKILFLSFLLSLLMVDAQAATNLCMKFPSGTPVKCVDSSSGGGGSGNVGIGTTGRIPVYQGTTTVGSPYNNTMDSNGNIGVGSASPGQNLDVQGTVRITGGTGSLSFDVEGTLSKSYFAGNVGIGTITIGDKLVVVPTSGSGITINGLSTTPSVVQSTQNDTFTVGSITGTPFQEGQSITFSGAVSLSSVVVQFMANNGSPTGTVTMDIQTLSVGLPSGVLVSAGATTTATVTPSQNNTFSFVPPVSLAAGSYSFVVRPTTVQSGTNFWQVGANSGGGYAGGDMMRSNNGVWSNLTPYDMTFTMNFAFTAPTVTFQGTGSQTASISSNSTSILNFNDSSGTTRMSVNGSNVGIGVTSPTQALDVAGTVRLTGLIYSTNPATNYVLTSDSAGVITLQKTIATSAAGGTNAVQYNSGSSTFAGTETAFSFNGSNVGIGTTSGRGALDVQGTVYSSSFTVLPNGNVGIGTFTPRQLFDVRGTINTTALTVNINGNIGIGTDNAQQNLTVWGSSSGSLFTGLVIQNSQTATNSGESVSMLATNSAGTVNSGTTLSSRRTSLGGNGATVFTINTSRLGTAIVEAMRIDEWQNVGIGTSAPIGKLDVEGTQPTIFYGRAGPGMGNVGIGSINPGQFLDIKGTARIIQSVGTAFDVQGTTQRFKDITGGTCSSITFQSGVMTTSAVPCTP